MPERAIFRFIHVHFFYMDKSSFIGQIFWAMQTKGDFFERERECERLFEAAGPFWFFTTEGLDRLLYSSREEFIAGTNILAISAAKSGVTVISDTQMSNHHHVMARGSLSQAGAFREIFRDKSRRYQLALGNKSLKDWDIRIDATEDVTAFRNRIVYIDRNAYVARRDRRCICRSHDIDLPSSYRVLDGMILRSSFIDYQQTESLFHSANQYFSLLSRHGESDVEIAQMLGEGIQLPNEEVFQIVAQWHRGRSLRELTPVEKALAAKRMKLRLSSSNKQITQVLQLPPEEVERLFPVPR